MLSSAKIGRSSWWYYQNSVAVGACEYYLGHGEAQGRWFGRGLAELGLENDGIVAEAELEAVFAWALHPVAGTPLGRAWRTDAVTGFDLTFSAPKSVSTLWSLGGTVAGQHVVAAHRAAVTAALTYLDTHAGLSRRGTDGVEQVATAGLVAALFDHRTSRAGDPQLHTHALVPNKLRCVDGVWRTIDGHGKSGTAPCLDRRPPSCCRARASWCHGSCRLRPPLLASRQLLARAEGTTEWRSRDPVHPPVAFAPLDGRRKPDDGLASNRQPRQSSSRDDDGKAMICRWGVLGRDAVSAVGLCMFAQRFEPVGRRSFSRPVVHFGVPRRAHDDVGCSASGPGEGIV